MLARSSALNIALVSPYDAAHPGGVSEHVTQLADQFRLQGHRVHRIAPTSRPIADPEFTPLGRITPVAVNGSVARVSLSLTLAPQIRQILRRERFDVVHIHEPFAPTLPTTFLSCSEGVNVGTFHAAGTRSIGYACIQAWLKRLAPRLRGRIAVSRAAQEFAGRYFPAEYAIIPNGVDVATYGSKQAPYPGLDDGVPTVLFVGRFNEDRKGFRYLLEAMALIQASHPEVRLVVAGGGDPAPFRALIRSQHIRNVHFLGFVTKQQLAALYQTTTLFCAPSTGGESFGIVLLEAMAAGCPVVAADNPGYRDVLENRREGLLVPARNAQALAVAILQLIGNPDSRQAMAEAGRRKAARYAWDRVAGDILSYYSRVMA